MMVDGRLWITPHRDVSVGILRGSARMRAVVDDRYGPAEVLRVDEVERPVPTEDEDLVSVHASTVTRGDTMGVRSAEYRFTRVLTGIRRPRRTRSGRSWPRDEEVDAGRDRVPRRRRGVGVQAGETRSA